MFQVGKGEIDEALVKSTADCLAARELIKMKVLDTSTYTAKEAAALLAPYRLTMPLAFDIEDDVHRKMTTKQRTDITIAFLEEIEKAGYYPMVYASQSWLEYSLDLTRLTRYDKWVARWASSTSFRPLSMWQYTNKGKVSGITTNVDLDYSYKDYTKIVTPRTHALTKADTGKTVSAQTTTRPAP